MDIKFDRTKNGQSENLFSDIASLLSAPFQSETPALDSFFSFCPWCEMESSHLLISKGLIRKDEFSCLTCGERTSKCIRFDSCKNATKSSFFWDDALCVSCERLIQRVGDGELSLRVLLEGQPDRDGEKIENDDYQYIKSSAGVVSNIELSELEVSEPAKFQSESNEIQQNRNEENCVESQDSMFSQHLPESQVHVGESGSFECFDEKEPWRIVLCALMNWPGPEKKNIDRYRKLCCHKAWINRWIISCGGDQEWALRRILAHLEWRQEFQLDTILDEDWSAMDERGEMFVSGVDRDGCPSWTWRANLHDAAFNGSAEYGTRYLICTMERTWAVNPGAERLSVICDCQNLSLANYEHKMFLQCLDILSEHYPDNLKKNFMFPVSWAMHAVASVGCSFLHPDTRTKMALIRQDQVGEALRACFAEDQIEPRLGGTLNLAAAATRRVLEEDSAALAAWLDEERRAAPPMTPQARDLVQRVLSPHLAHLLSPPAIPDPLALQTMPCRIAAKPQERPTDEDEWNESYEDQGKWKEEHEKQHMLGEVCDGQTSSDDVMTDRQIQPDNRISSLPEAGGWRRLAAHSAFRTWLAALSVCLSAVLVTTVARAAT